LLSGYASYGSEKLSFLHSIPDEIEKEYKLADLLDKCARQGLNVLADGDRFKSMQSRFTIADNLIKIFEGILSEINF